MIDLFKVLADETRLRCLAIIYEHKEVCVCELVHALRLPQSKISRHLSIMKLNNIVSQRRHGQWVLYSIHPELSAFKINIIESTVNELAQKHRFIKDNKMLLKMNDRPDVGVITHV